MIGYQFLLEIDALNASHVAVTCRFCCQPGFTGGGYTWEPRVVDPGLQQVSLFSADKITGRSTYSYGEIVLGNFKNTDTLSGPTDYLKDYTFYGRPVRMYMGPVGASYPSGFPQVYTAVIEGTNINEDTVSFTLRGRQSELDIPLETGTFLGNNVAPGGVEGIPTMKSSRKPAILGRVFNMSPVPCNTSRLIYAVSPLTGIADITQLNSGFQVFDNGVELFCDEVVADYTYLMEPYAMARPGMYKASPDGYIQLGATPAGQVTCSGASDGMALISHPINLITQILTLADAAPNRTHANFVDMIDGSTFTDFEDKYERGVVTTGQNISALLDFLVAPCGYWYFTATGKLRVRTMKLTGYATPVYIAVMGTNITSAFFRKTTDTKGGVPASKVTLKCGKNYSLQTNVAGSVDPLRLHRLSTEWLTYTVGSWTYTYPLSEEFVVETALTRSTRFEDGYTLGLTLSNMMSRTHDLLDIEIITTEFLNVYNINPGDIITVNLNGRFGYSGKDMMVVSKTINFVDEIVKFTLWGMEGI